MFVGAEFLLLNRELDNSSVHNHEIVGSDRLTDGLSSYAPVGPARTAANSDHFQDDLGAMFAHLACFWDS